MPLVVEMSADEAKLQRAIAKLERQNQRLEQKLKDVGKAGKKAGDDTAKSMMRANRDAFGPKALGQVKSYAAGLVGIGAAVGVVASGFRFMREESKAALSSLQALTEGKIRLNQVAMSGEELESMNRWVDRVSIQTGISRDKAQQLLFSAKSEGFMADAQWIAASRQVMDPLAGATLAGQVPKLFPGTGLTPRQAVNMGLVAAQQSRLDVETIASVLPSIAEGAGLAGATPAETYALVSVLASRLATGKTAADRGKAYGTKIGIMPELAGLGIVGAFEEIEQWSEIKRRGWLGQSQELNVMHTLLREEKQLIEERTAEIRRARFITGTAESPMVLGRARAAGDLGLRAQLEMQRAARRREVAREGRLGIDEAGLTSSKDLVLSVLDEMGLSGAQKFGAKSLMEVAHFLGLSEGVVRTAGAAGAALFTHPVTAMSQAPEMVEQWQEVMQSQREAAEALEQAAAHLERAAAGGPTMLAAGVDK